MAGETVEATIVYDGADVARRILVRVHPTCPFVTRDIEPSAVRLLGAGPDPLRPIRLSSYGPRPFAFDDLEPGSYVVEIDDPRFELWQQSGVRPGDVVSAEPKGSVVLKLDVRDAETNAVISLYSVRARLAEGRSVDGEAEPVLHDGSVPLPDSCLGDLIPGDIRIIIEAPNYGPNAVSVTDLLPRETRLVSVLMHRAPIVRGRITTGGRPLEGQEVLLLKPAEVDDARQRVVRKWQPRRDERDRVELESAHSDDAGRVEFRPAVRGTYVLYAERPGGFCVSSDPFTVGHGDEVEIALELAEAGWLVGRVVGSRPGLPPGCSIWVRPEHDVSWGGRRQMPKVIESDGSFHFGPVAPGLVEVFFMLPEDHYSFQMSLPDRRPSGALKLGKLTMPEGATVEREFSIEATTPASVSIQVSSHGVPLRDASVRLRGEGCQYWGETDARGKVVVSAFASTFDVHVVSPNMDAEFHNPDAAVVGWGDEISLDIDVQVTSATLTLIDAKSGEPLAGHSVTCEYREGNFRPLRLPTTADASGRVTFALPPGEYRFVLDPPDPLAFDREGGMVTFPAASARPNPDKETILHWTAGGPEADELRF